jgi:hypothetical protein
MEAHQILTFFLSTFCNNYLLGFGLIYVLAFSPPLSIFINAERNLQISRNSQSFQLRTPTCMIKEKIIKIICKSIELAINFPF